MFVVLAFVFTLLLVYSRSYSKGRSLTNVVRACDPTSLLQFKLNYYVRWNVTDKVIVRTNFRSAGYKIHVVLILNLRRQKSIIVLYLPVTDLSSVSYTGRRLVGE